MYCVECLWVDCGWIVESGGWRVKMAGDEMVLGMFDERRVNMRARFKRLGAARMEMASGRGSDGTWHIAFQALTVVLGLGVGYGDG